MKQTTEKFTFPAPVRCAGCAKNLELLRPQRIVEFEGIRYCGTECARKAAHSGVAATKRRFGFFSRRKRSVYL